MTHYEEHPLSRIVTIQAIVSADYIHGPEPNTQLHAHQGAWELCVCLEGEVLVTKDDRDLLLQTGQALFVQPGIPHCISTLQKTTAFVVSFTCSVNSSEHLMLLHDALLPVSGVTVAMTSAVCLHTCLIFPKSLF